MADSEKLDRALEHATRALDLIPGLAEGELAIGFYLFRTGDRSGALAQLEDVVRAHPNFPAALFGLGIVQAWGWDLPPDWNTRQAGIENMLKAARLDPANPDVHGWAVQFLQTEHRFEEAFEYLDRYDRLTGKPSNIYRAWMHLATGNQKRARSFAEIILAEDPGFFPRITMRAPFDVIRRAVLTHAEREAAFGTLASVERTLPDGTSVGSMGVGCSDDPGWALTNCIRRALHFEAQRDSLAARAAWDSLAVIMAANPSSISFKEAPFIYLGARDTVRALEAAEGLVRRHPHQQLSKLILARVFAEFGQSDRAITLLEEQLEPPSWVTVPLLRVDPWWDPLRDHPRFQALLAGGEPDQVF
jgi:tetratricopeptide (TPR) repeat protein